MVIYVMDQVISLTNSSSHYSDQNTGDFQWNIEGAENIEENGSDITFTYSEDGSYLWTLTYTDPIGGCVVNFDTTICKCRLYYIRFHSR